MQFYKKGMAIPPTLGGMIITMEGGELCNHPLLFGSQTKQRLYVSNGSPLTVIQTRRNSSIPRIITRSKCVCIQLATSSF